MADPRDAPERAPRTFEDHFYAQNYRFGLYRVFQDFGESWQFFARNRTAWHDAGYPFDGPVRPQQANPMQERVYAREGGFPSLDTPPPGLQLPPYLQRARQRLAESKEYFRECFALDGASDLDRSTSILIQEASRLWWQWARTPIQVYGVGVGLRQSFARFSFKDKSSWLGYVILTPRFFENARLFYITCTLMTNAHILTYQTQKACGWKKRLPGFQVERAAHCVQMIHREDVGLEPSRKFKFDLIDDADSSDGENDDSSGDESRADGPESSSENESMVDVQETRRYRWQNNVPSFIAKHGAWKTRMFMKSVQVNARNNWIQRIRDGEDVDQYTRDKYDLNRMDYILLEFVENGDVGHLIYKLNEHGQTVPNRVLWAFWLCMIRACVAMEYPPRKFHPRRRVPAGVENAVPDVQETERGEMVAGKRSGEALFEGMPPKRRRWAKKRQVHFDIDPLNIFIGTTDLTSLDGEHDLVPQLKARNPYTLADFGLAKNMKRNKNNEYYFRQRRMAKSGFFTPEQFGADWDYVSIASGPLGWEMSEQEIAGNYGAHTNIFQMALSMWVLITKKHPPIPPQPRSVDSLRADGGAMETDVSYCPLITTDAEYDWCDPELRFELERCLRHDPRRRPKLQDLLARAKEAVRARRYPDPGESDAAIRQWVNDWIFGPGVPVFSPRRSTHALLDKPSAEMQAEEKPGGM
ncbi:hypothetical protein F4778DRAFT_782355 [Xylariomycetidae sp. FL2044]|nr:hypothetical protein F4778DRAFT_782355 [Xylariomycetidae sp. FL2044]